MEANGGVISIFCDGSSKLVDGYWYGSYCMSCEQLGHVESKAGKDWTNNIAELNGMLSALKYCQTILEDNKDAKINIYTDSQLVYNTLTKWKKDWTNPLYYDLESGKHRKKKFQIKNYSLVKQLFEAYDLLEGKDINIRHILSHGKDGTLPVYILNGNAYVDTVAKKTRDELIEADCYVNK